jgi:O-antigen/teichoic acid export membrane protein
MDKRRLAFGTLMGGVANALKVGLQIALLPLMARLLGPHEYGLYALAMPAIMFVIMLADGGLGASLAREPESNVEVWSTAFWALLGAAILFGVAAITWALLVAGFVHQPRLPAVIAGLSPTLLLYALTVPSGALLLRQARLVIGPIGDILGNVAGAVCAIALAVFGAGVWSMVAQSLVTYTLKFIVIFAGAPIYPKFKFSLSELRSHLTIGGAIVGSKLVDTGGRVIENALIGRSFGASFLGSFSLAGQIPRFVCDALINPLWLTLYVHALRSDDEGRFQVYGKFARLGALILFPTATLGAAEGDILIEFLLGPSWLAMSPLFQLLLLTYAFSAPVLIGSAILYAKGETSIQLRIIGEVAVIRVATVLLAPSTGVWLLWAGLPAANLYFGWRGVIAYCRSVDRPPTTLIKPLLIPAACAIGAGLVGWGAASLLRGNLITAIVEVTGSFSLYLILLILLDRQRLLNDLAELYQVIGGRPFRRVTL